MKIIIVGAGISGLSAYLFLKKYLLPSHPSLQISIFESHHPTTTAPTDATFADLSSSTALVGGGLGVSPNGMRLLREISPALHDAVTRAGFRCENFVFRGAKGYKLNVSPTSDFRGSKGNPEGEQEWCVSISRHGLWKCLAEEVGDGVVVYRKVVKAVKGERPKVVFEDGMEEVADLVIGADGVRSVVLKGVFEGETESVEPVYEGLIGVGGFVPGPVPPSILADEALVFTFGPNGFFGYGVAGPSSTMWWSTCEAETPPEQRKISVEEMQAQLKARHGNWKDPVIHDIIAKCDVDHIYPVWTTPSLPKYGGEGLVCVGDAAHALQPTSGQGSSQALESARCLAVLLSRFLRKDEDGSDARDAVDKAIKSLYEIRSPRIEKIAERTKIMAGRKGDMGLFAEYMTYFFLWLVGKVPSVGKALLGDVNKELYYWDMDGLIDAAVKKYQPSAAA